MKLSSYIGCIVAAALCIPLFTSCDSVKDNFEEMNVNPQEADDLDPEFQLTYILLGTSGERYENWRTNLIYSSTMMQHFATLPTYWSGDKYLYNPPYSSAMWDRYYPNVVKNVQDLVWRLGGGPEGTLEAENVNRLAIARIWRVVFFNRLTDLYGDVPYFKAGLGALTPDDPQSKSPPYDAQSDIYADMLNELEEAAASFDPSQPTFGNGDVIYGGDIEKWERYANSMMMRLGLRLIKVDPTAAKAWVEKAARGPLMTDLDHIAFVPHTDGPAGINRNGTGEVFSAECSSSSGNCTMKLSKFFVDWMLALGDPRLSVYGSLPNGDTSPSNAKGLPNGYAASSCTRPSGGSCDIDDFDPDYDALTYTQPNWDVIGRTDAPMFFQTHAEVHFMLAEAAERGWDVPGTAAGHYAAGVRAAMEYLSLYGPGGVIEGGDIDDYLAANPYSSVNGLQLINNQYWAATLLNEYEAFANWRRTGFPALTPVDYPGNATNSTIPRRLRYPGPGANPDNYNQAIARQGPDRLDTRMWWDAP
jgi:hypothetical protein